MKVKDYTGEEVEINTLISRLAYRQKHPATNTAPVNRDLNLFVCWLGHFREGVRVSPRCSECKLKWRYQIKAGVLIRLPISKPSSLTMADIPKIDPLPEGEDW